MPIYIDLFAIITFLGIIQGYFLAFVLFRNKNGNYRANHFLALLLCAFSTSISNIFLLQIGLLRTFPYALKVPGVVLLLFGPLFFFYVRLLISPKESLTYQDFLHFVPALLLLIRFIPEFLSDKATKNAFILSPAGHYHFSWMHYEYLGIIVCAQIHLWIYLFFISLMVKRYQLKIKDYFSNTDQQNLSWIQFFIYVFIFVYSIFLCLSVIAIKINYMISYNLISVTVSLSIFALGYRGLKQTELFSFIEPSKNLKQESNVFTDELIESLTARLNRLMTMERVYINPDLTLDDLAKKLLVSRNTLSQFINESLGTSFYDYINRYRVEEMKRLLFNPEKVYMTIVALSAEAGFNSKTTFNRIFKQYTHMTPTQFRQSTSLQDVNENTV